MSYITLTELLKSPGATELAQVAGPEHMVVVPPDLLVATIAGSDRSAWSSEQQAAADAAVVTITAARDDAGQLIDSYLRTRYTLPLADDQPVLRRLQRAITRHDLHRHRVDKDHPISLAYRDAVRLLEQIAAGRVTLGAADPAAPARPELTVDFSNRESAFADSLRKI